MKTKYLVKIEFCYNGPPDFRGSTSTSKEVVIGVYGDVKKACEDGNKVLEELESRYPLNPAYNRKRRLSHTDASLRLISNLAYIKTPFTFYLSVKKLNYELMPAAIDDVLEDIDKYREYKKILEEE